MLCVEGYYKFQIFPTSATPPPPLACNSSGQLQHRHHLTLLNVNKLMIGCLQRSGCNWAILTVYPLSAYTPIGPVDCRLRLPLSGRTTPALPCPSSGSHPILPSSNILTANPIIPRPCNCLIFSLNVGLVARFHSLSPAGNFDIVTTVSAAAY
jgi:hypothetical protein